MDFGHCGSGASTSSAVTVFPTYFNYATDIRQDNRVSYSTAAAWFTMLQEDLNRGWPMQYRIANHSIVCDGWQVAGTNQIHLNYGWSDSHTAWYTVDNLYCNWTGCSPSVEFVIRHIHPNAVTPPANITMTAPNGGETWTVGNPVAIAWTSQNLPENVKLELNRNYPTGNWEVIAASVANSGSYNFVLTGAASTAARIRVSGAIATSVSDISDGNFTIAAPLPVGSITVTAPNGPEVWTVGNSVRVSWTSVNFADNIRIELNRNYPTGTWELLAASTANTGNFIYRLSGPASMAARVRVSSTSDSTVCDISNANFTILAITPPPPEAGGLTIITPNGNETLTSGYNTILRWDPGDVTGYVAIQINSNYPTGSWAAISAMTSNDGSYAWRVSGSPTSHARMRIWSLTNPAVGDTSDGDFSVRGGREVEAGVPGLTGLSDAFPNPFNPVTTLRFDLAAAGSARLGVYDVTGRLVRLLVDDIREAGRYQVTFDGSDLASGMYFVRLQIAGENHVRRIELLK
jgi:hypothetical protein